MKTLIRGRKLLALAILGGLCAAGSPCEAQPVHKLTEFFEQKIQKLEAALAEVENRPADPKAKPIVLENINIDLIPTASIGISEVLQLQIMPEIDFVLQPDPAPEAPAAAAGGHG